MAHFTPDIPAIHIKGAREHNLKNIELFLPRNQLVVLTGVSGSGKSSLAFDTIYAEGYRKYIDSLSTRARQILEQVKRPDVDYIHGLSPVIAIEQRGGGGSNPRSTVATVTEIADYARLMWALCGVPYCPIDGGSIVRRSLDDCIDHIFEEPEGSRLMILAPCLNAKAAILREELPRLKQRGFQRMRIDGEIKDLYDSNAIKPATGHTQVDLVIDRVVLSPAQRSRIADSLELAFREGKDRAIILAQKTQEHPWREFIVSQNLACGKCGKVFEQVTPRHFSYNHPDGACPECGGMGRTRQFAAELLVPDPAKSTRKGAIKPWRIGSKRIIIRHNAILKQLSEQLPFDATTPWQDLDPDIRKTILHGAGNRLFCFKLKPGNRKGEMQKFSGVMADLEEMRRETRSEGLKARLMAYQVSSVCQACIGKRLNPLSLAVQLRGNGFADLMAMSISEALKFVHNLLPVKGELANVSDALHGLEQRLHFLAEVGLGYLTLDRQYATLSGGEAQRVRLATQLGMGLVGVAYVLDEPTIGLHAYDHRKLLRTLLDLRDRGNAVIVVEHDEATIMKADHLIELGPGAGNQGGEIIFEGTPAQAMRSRRSRCGPFLSGELQVENNAGVCKPGNRWFTVHGASHNNLKKIDVRFPAGLLTCVSGVSGSGKSSLVNDIMANASAWKLHRAKSLPGAHSGISGLEHFKRSIRVSQDPIGRSPRSNPATYIKLFDLLRDLFARSSLAKVRGYKASRFSFNVRGGRCEKCRGDGVIKLDMQFLSDVYAECPSCHGQRYNRETLEICFKGSNIAQVLDMTVDEALRLFRHQPKIIEKLRTLRAVGLGYIKLGQPAITLSGGEAQRIKLSLELSKRSQGDTIYFLDEPTTGLHWIDIQKLMDLLFELRDAGNTIIIIEHNLDVVNLADWIIDLGPGGGVAGGHVLFSGSREEFLQCGDSVTARCLNEFLQRRMTTEAAI